MNNIIQNIIKQELQQKNLFYPFIAGLTKRERVILELRKQLKTLQEIGEKFSITRERVRQVEAKANLKLETQAKIIQGLARKISEYVFTEDEIERAFSDYLNENQQSVSKTSTAVIDYSRMKLQWMDFSRWLWEGKKDAKRNA